MTREELLTRLQRYEWADIEFKKARGGVPEDAYKTVSAFANTAGGWLVFGVRERHHSFDVVGVVEVDKVQNDFLSTLRAGDKLNRVIAAAEDAHEVDGKTLLVFHVPESPKRDKPVYLGGDIRQSFIRRGAGDERCTMREIERFLRDASDAKYDGELLHLDAEKVFDAGTVRWYRRVLEDRSPGQRQALSDLEFLHEMGFVKERQDGRLAPTRAAVLVLGRGRYVRQVLARPVVDCQMVNTTFHMWDPDLRWDDRIVVEENLVQAWLTLSERFVRRAERPFRIDPATLRRDDDPPDYISFREATINLLLHQDYGDQHRHATIRLFRDRMEFKNPGDAFASTEELLEPGAKEIRNPDIVAAFRRLGLSEQAGTGIRSIFRNWQALGHVPPAIDNDKAAKVFEVCFSAEALLSEAQQRFQSRLGLRLQEPEARVFVLACRNGHVSVVDAKAVTGLAGAEAAAVLEALHVQGVLQPLEEGLYGLAGHLAGRADLPRHGHSRSDHVDQRHDSLSTGQADMSTAHVTHRQTDMSTAHGHDREQAGGMPSGSPMHGHDAVSPPDGEQADMCSSGHVTTHQASAGGEVGPLDGFARATLIPPLSRAQRRILALCDVPRLLAELMENLGVVNRGHFKKRHLDPLIHDRLIAMTSPATPRVPGQRYVLTEAGVRLQAILSAEREGSSHG